MKLLIQPATSLKFVHLALRSKRLDTPELVGIAVTILKCTFAVLTASLTSAQHLCRGTTSGATSEQTFLVLPAREGSLISE